jgi:hypothetical protein
MKYKTLAKQEMKKELKEVSNWMSSTENRVPDDPTVWKMNGSVCIGKLQL